MTVTAESDGVTGTASLTLPPDLDWIKRLEASVENAKKELAARERDIPKEVEDSRKRVAELTSRRVSRPADGSFGGWPNEELSRITSLYTARAYVEFESKRVLSLYRRNVAYAQRDFSAALAIVEGDLALIDGLKSIEAEQKAALRALLNEARGAAAAAGATQTLKDNFIKTIEAHIANPGVTIDSRRLSTLNDLLNLAYEAGDVGAYIRATEAIAAIYMTDQKQWGSNLANTYHLAAARVAEMSGDTARAVEYFNKGIEAERAANPAATHLTPEQVKQRRPAWWPREAK